MSNIHDIAQCITESEWEIMQIIWANPPLSSREIIQLTQTTTNWQVGTIKSFIHRLVKKNILTPTKDNNKVVYLPTISSEQSYQCKITKWLDSLCQTKRGTLLNQLIETYPLSQQDIQSLQQTLTIKAQTATDTLSCQCAPHTCTCHTCHTTYKEE